MKTVNTLMYYKTRVRRFTMMDWVVVLRPIRQNTGHFRDVLQVNCLSW